MAENMRGDDLVGKLVREVMRRLAARVADGGRGRIIVVFTGATSALPQALDLCKLLALDGYRVLFTMSEAAASIYGDALQKELDDFPMVEPLAEKSWLPELKRAQAVVVPMLSLNSLAKIALLIADNVSTNLILQGLFLGKPVLLAQNGAQPADQDRQALGFRHGSSRLLAMVEQYFHLVEAYGCWVGDLHDIRWRLPEMIRGDHRAAKEAGAETAGRAKERGRVITAAEVRRAASRRQDLQVGAGWIITPLALELAGRLGVRVLGDR